MRHTEEYKNHDELKGRFTVWLEKVVRNAKINYIKRLKRQPPTLYLEEIPESALPAQNLAADAYTKSEFEFEEERLAEAFSKLRSLAGFLFDFPAAASVSAIDFCLFLSYTIFVIGERQDLLYQISEIPISREGDSHGFKGTRLYRNRR